MPKLRGDSRSMLLVSRHRIWIKALIAGLIMGSTVPCAHADPQPIHKVKAAFVFKFMNYVEWPAEAETDVPLRIGVFGNEDVASALEDLTRGKLVEGHPIKILRAETIDALTSCRIVFIDASAGDAVGAYHGEFERSNVLTISDSKTFTRQGGVIKLVEKGKRIRIEINVTAAERSNLKISSKLLDLATVIRDERS